MGVQCYTRKGAKVLSETCAKNEDSMLRKEGRGKFRTARAQEVEDLHCEIRMIGRV